MCLFNRDVFPVFVARYLDRYFIIIYSHLHLSYAASRSHQASDEQDGKPEAKKVRGGGAAKKVFLSGWTPVLLFSVHTGTEMYIYYKSCYDRLLKAGFASENSNCSIICNEQRAFNSLLHVNSV